MYICEQGKLPVITLGKLTPDLLFDFEYGAYSYFSFKDIKAEKEVSKVAGGLQDGHIQTWYRLNRVAVDAVGFPSFMVHVRKSWLEPGWEQNVKLVILTSHQGITPISDWIMLLKSTNALLNGHACKLSDEDIWNHIQSHIHPDTMTATTTAELHLIASYEKYKHSLKVVDDARVGVDDLLRSAVKQMMSQLTSVHRTAITHFKDASSSSSSGIAINPSVTCAPDRLPALNAAECALLMEHEGCFKCCCFYVTHKSADCPEGFPNKSSYSTLTEADALNAKKHQKKKGKSYTAAVVSPPAAPMVNPAIVAAVVMPLAVLSDGSDSKYVLAPFFVPHLFFNCLVGGSTMSSQISIWALIDHGSDAVLIDPFSQTSLDYAVANCRNRRRWSWLLVTGIKLLLLMNGFLLQ